MDWTDNAEQASFRAGVRELLETRLPGLYRRVAEGEGEAEEGAGNWIADRKSSDPDRRQAAADSTQLPIPCPRSRTDAPDANPRLMGPDS